MKHTGNQRIYIKYQCIDQDHYDDCTIWETTADYKQERCVYKTHDDIDEEDKQFTSTDDWDIDEVDNIKQYKISFILEDELFLEVL